MVRFDSEVGLKREGMGTLRATQIAIDSKLIECDNYARRGVTIYVIVCPLAG